MVLELTERCAVGTRRNLAFVEVFKVVACKASKVVGTDGAVVPLFLSASCSFSMNLRLASSMSVDEAFILPLSTNVIR